MASSMSWTEVETNIGTNGSAAQGAGIGRSSHTITPIGNLIYMLGGENEPRVPLGSELYALDMDSKVWKPVDCGGKGPSPRVGHAAAALNDVIFFFGGRSGVEFGEGAENGMFIFHTKGTFWERLLGSPEGPPARSYHAMAADPDNDKIYVFGGCGAAGQGRLNDLWEFDPPSRQWSQLPTCDAIEGRGGAGLAVDVAGRALYVVGGFAGRELGDVHRYDLDAQTWEEVATPANPLPPRSMFGGAHVTGRLIVLACGEVDPSDKGHEGAGLYANDVCALDLDKIEEGWQRLPVGGSRPSPRGWFAGALTPQGLIVHGGISPDNERLSSMFLLSVPEGECEDIVQACAKVGLEESE